MIKRLRRRFSLPMKDISEITEPINNDGEKITDKEVDKWQWKSYHKIYVKQNMGNRGIQHN